MTSTFYRLEKLEQFVFYTELKKNCYCCVFKSIYIKARFFYDYESFNFY